LNTNPSASPYMPKQERGTRPACAIPYELHVEGKQDKDIFRMQFTNSKDMFGEKSVGAPFIVYDMMDNSPSRNYLVLPGDDLADEWNISNNYHLRVYGPNGFYREFTGNKVDPVIEVACTYQQKPGTKKLSGNIELHIKNTSTKSQVVIITDNAYKAKAITQTVAAGSTATIPVDLHNSNNWYDVSISIKDINGFERRYAGHVETGEASITDPFMGGVV